MSLYINSTIVLALVQLRGLNLATLAQIAHIPQADLAKWVQGADDEAVSFEQKIEVLNFLGIRGEAPRGDVVHYWHIQEGLFTSSQKAYAPLRVVIEAFGPAQAVHLHRQEEPIFSLDSTTYFGLKFDGFHAMLRIDTGLLKEVSFVPGEFPGVTWSPAQSLAIANNDYDRFEPGAFKVKTFEHRLLLSAEQAAWDQLRANAITQGLRAEQVAAVLLGAPAPKMPGEAAEAAPVVRQAIPNNPPVENIIDIRAAARPVVEPEVPREAPQAAETGHGRRENATWAPRNRRRGSDSRAG